MNNLSIIIYWLINYLLRDPSSFNFQKSFCLILRFQCFCHLVNGLWLIGVAFWHQIQVSAMFWSSQKDVQRKTIQCGGEISSRSAVGTWLVTKTMPRIAIGSQGCPYWGPGVSREAVLIDFHGFPLIPRGCGGLCRRSPTPLGWCNKARCILQYR